MIIPSQIRARFPGPFDSASDEFLNLIIDEAASEIDEAKWGSRYDQGMLYLSAHLASRSVSAPGGGGHVGPLTSKRIGDVSWGYGSPAAATSTAYGWTDYGNEYLRLRQIVQGGPVTACLVPGSVSVDG